MNGNAERNKAGSTACSGATDLHMVRNLPAALVFASFDQGSYRSFNRLSNNGSGLDATEHHHKAIYRPRSSPLFHLPFPPMS